MSPRVSITLHGIVCAVRSSNIIPDIEISHRPLPRAGGVTRSNPGHDNAGIMPPKVGGGTYLDLACGPTQVTPLAWISISGQALLRFWNIHDRRNDISMNPGSCEDLPNTKF